MTDYSALAVAALVALLGAMVTNALLDVFDDDAGCGCGCFLLGTVITAVLAIVVYGLLTM